MLLMAPNGLVRGNKNSEKWCHFRLEVDVSEVMRIDLSIPTRTGKIASP
jgi:hypothetical protein